MLQRESLSVGCRLAERFYGDAYRVGSRIYASRARSASSPVRVRVGGEDFVYDVPLSPGAGLDIAVCGIREPFSSEFFVRTMRGVSPDVHVDIGANFGYYAVMAGRFASRVVAFEPLPWLEGYLRSNLDRERVDYSLYGAAVYPSESGWVSMEVPEAHNLSRVSGSGSLRVPAVPPERVLDFVDGVWTLRMDIEGAERDVLLQVMHGAASLGALPAYVFVEFHPAYVGADFVNRADLLFYTYGYRAVYFFEPVPQVMCFPGWRVFEWLGYVGRWRGYAPWYEAARRGWVLHAHYVRYK